MTESKCRLTRDQGWRLGVAGIFILLLWLTTFSLCRTVIQSFVTWTPADTIYQTWQTLLNQTLTERDRFGRCARDQQDQCWATLNATAASEEARYLGVLYRNQIQVNQRTAEADLAAQTMADLLLATNAWVAWIEATQVDQPAILADLQNLVHESVNCSTAQADEVRSWIEFPATDPAILLTTNQEVAAQRQAAWDDVALYGEQRLQYDQDYVANKTQAVRDSLTELQVDLTATMLCSRSSTATQPCPNLALYEEWQAEIGTVNADLDHLQNLADEVNAVLAAAAPLLLVYQTTLDGLAAVLSGFKAMLDIVGCGHLVQVPSYVVNLPSPIGDIFPALQFDFDADWTAFDEHLQSLVQDWGRWTTGPWDTPELEALNSPFADYDPPALNLTTLVAAQFDAGETLQTRTQLWLELDIEPVPLTTNATIPPPVVQPGDTDLELTPPDWDVAAVDGEYDFGAIVNLFNVMEVFLEVVDIIWRVFRSVQILIQAYFQTWVAQPEVWLSSSLLHRSTPELPTAPGGSLWRRITQRWTTTQTAGVGVVAWALTIVIVLVTTGDPILVVVVAVGGGLMLMSALSLRSTQPTGALGKAAAWVRASWLTLLKLFVVTTLLAVVLLALLSVMFGIYIPLYRDFQRGCSVPQSVVPKPAPGTWLARNVHAMVFNYAAWDTNAAMLAQLQIWDQARLDYCSRQYTSSSAEQERLELQMQALLTNITNAQYQLQLWSSCVRPELQLANATAAAWQAAGALVYPWSAEQQALIQQLLALAAWNQNAFAHVQRWTLADGVAQCDALPLCSITCTGPDGDWLTPLALEAACQLEGFLHGHLLQGMGALILFLGLNLARWCWQRAVLRTWWDIISNPVQVKIMVPTFVDQHTQEFATEKRQAVQAAIDNQKWLALFYWIATVVFSVLPIIFLVALVY